MAEMDWDKARQHLKRWWRNKSWDDKIDGDVIITAQVCGSRLVSGERTQYLYDEIMELKP